MPFLIIVGLVLGFDIGTSTMPLCTDKVTHNCVSQHVDDREAIGAGGG